MDSADRDRLTFPTRAVHAGENRPPVRRRAAGGVVYLTAPFLFSTEDELEAAFSAGGRDALYSRQGNPTVRVVEEKLAALESAEDAVAFSSGLAAITGTLSTLLGSGDRLLVARELYGGTAAWLRALEGRHPEITLEAVPLARLAAHLDDPANPAPRVVYLETPTNPRLEVVDLAAVSAAARRRGAQVVVDSTFATPVLQKPLELGAQVVVHSATKYLGGHSDLTAGLAAGDAETMTRVRETMVLSGSCLDPHAAFLLARGMKTLALRVERQSATAARLAEFLSGHPRVLAVFYPGEDPIARRQMTAGGGMLAFEIDGGGEVARWFVDRLALFQIIPSLGGVESGATLPAVTSHRRLTVAEREELGISPGLVRLSVGIEDAGDLERDLEQALG